MQSTLSYVIVLIFCLQLGLLQAQTSSYKNGWTYKFAITDYLTLDKTHQDAMDPDHIFHPNDVNYAGEIGYHRFINKHLNIAAALRLGSIDAYHTVNDPNDSLCQPCEQRRPSELFFGTDVLAIYKFNNDWMIKEDFLLSPYVFVGIGGKYLSQRTGNFDFELPMGVGLNIKLNPQFYLQAQFEYRKSLIINRDNFVISGGLLWLLRFKSKNK